MSCVNRRNYDRRRYTTGLNSLSTLWCFLCQLSDTRVQNSTFLIDLGSPDTASFSRLTFRVSDDPVSSASDHTDARIALSTRAEHAQLDLVPVAYIYIYNPI